MKNFLNLIYALLQQFETALKSNMKINFIIDKNIANLYKLYIPQHFIRSSTRTRNRKFFKSINVIILVIW